VSSRVTLSNPPSVASSDAPKAVVADQMVIEGHVHGWNYCCMEGASPSTPCWLRRDLLSHHGNESLRT
jgi:hypothetical protein